MKPSYSQTILLPNLYQNPAFDPKNKMNPSQLQNHFDAFYEDFFCEMCKYGEVEEVVVCDNNNDRTSYFFRGGRGEGVLTGLRTGRSHRQCVRAFQIRGGCAVGVRCAECAMVRGAPDLLRAQSRHGFPRGVLSPELGRGLCARRVLQFHPSQGAE